MIRFGTAGNADSFYTQGYKSTAQAPEYIRKMGINAYEYQCGRGVRINPEQAQKLRENAQKLDVKLSLHAPYFISLSSLEEEKRKNSIGYILESARAARLIGADRVVVHSGSCSKISREEALVLARATLGEAVEELKKNDLYDIHLCPETMGKVNQLGTLDEVMQLCLLDEQLIPCIDFGHLNARTFGGLRTKEDFRQIFETVKNTLGEERMKHFHAHFSKIEYTENGGEKRHLTFADQTFGPDFEPLAELLVAYGCTPTIICESDGTQAEDAKTMLDIYLSKGGTL
ncbi:MAG: endonuclease IV [Ruminococcaceae bacterium]|nr:endonuclease IV [Oscillospiraceae bacterium]